MDPFMEIRKLPPSVVRELGHILDYGDHWKDLMAIVPKQLSKDTFEVHISETNPPKYNSEHIQIIDQGAIRLKKSPTAILIDEWGTSGRPRATLGNLAHLLTKAGLFRAADYVSVDLLQQEPVARPQSGPASTVKFEITDWLQHNASISTPKPKIVPDLGSLLRKIEYPELSAISESTVTDSESIQTKCRSFDSLISNMEYPFTETKSTFCADSDAGSALDDRRSETREQKNERCDESPTLPVSEKCFVKRNACKKGRYLKKKVVDIVNKIFPRKGRCDLIAFSSSSNLDGDMGGCKQSSSIDRRLARKENLKGMNILVSEQSTQYPTSETNIPDKTVPNISRLLEGEDRSSTTTKLVSDCSCGCHSGKEYEGSRNEKENRSSLVNEKRKAKGIPKDNGLCPNIPAFSKLLTEPHFSKYDNEENLEPAKSSRASRRHSV